MNRNLITALGIGIGIIAALGTTYFMYNRYFRSIKKSNTVERTLAIIKPDAVRTHATGKIIDKIEQAGFIVIDLRKVHLDREQAEKFYAVHQGKKFFHQLIDSMVSGPIVVLILEKLNAISEWRELMGATNPEQAKEGTIRKQFGVDITKNAVHGSDNADNAYTEIRFFFADRIRE